MPVHTDKQYYRVASAWLNEHSIPSDLIATPDLRISFYAERAGLQYRAGPIPEQARYVVRILGKGGAVPDASLGSYGLVRHFDGKVGSKGVAIYRKL